MTTATIEATEVTSDEALAIQEKFTTFRTELNELMIERHQEIDLGLAAIACGEHMALVGTFGIGKSMICDAFSEWMHGRRFSILLNKFTNPEELVGPLDIAKIRESVYQRMTKNTLVDADFAFVDEIFKGSSAILNTLLKILNERKFDNGSVTLDCPLRICVGASNEWPTGEGGKELGALFDRFLFRKEVRSISSDAGLDRLMWGKIESNFSTTITAHELDTADLTISGMPWEPEAKDAMMEIIRATRADGIMTGDRRVRKSVKACAAYAWTHGATSVEVDHLSILADCLWVDPTEQPRKVSSIVRRIANPVSLVLNGLMIEVDQIMGAVDKKEVKTIIKASKQLSEIRKKIKTYGDKGASQLKTVNEMSEKLRLSTIEAFDE